MKPATGAPLRGYVFAGLASLMWASTAAVTRLLLNGLANVQILVVSALFAFLALGSVSALTGKLGVIRTYSVVDYARFAYMALIGVFAYRFFFQASLGLIPTQEAFIINYTWPLMVVLCAVVVLNEKLTSRTIVAMVLSFLGVVVIATKGHLVSVELSAEGIGLALAGAFCYGLFSVLVKKQDYDRLASTSVYYGFALVYAFVATITTSHIPSLSWAQLAGLAWLGVFPSGLAFVFWGLALKHGPTATMSNVVFVTPFLSSIYVYILVGEPILISSLLGLAIIVGSILFQSRGTTAPDLAGGATASGV
jgi:drug/metabolite transporter (DMT)-like permease